MSLLVENNIWRDQDVTFVSATRKNGDSTFWCNTVTVSTSNAHKLNRVLLYGNDLYTVCCIRIKSYAGADVLYPKNAPMCGVHVCVARQAESREAELKRLLQERVELRERLCESRARNREMTSVMNDLQLCLNDLQSKVRGRHRISWSEVMDELLCIRTEVLFTVIHGHIRSS